MKLKQALKAAGIKHKAWAAEQGIKPKHVCWLINDGAIVIDGIVYRPAGIEKEPPPFACVDGIVYKPAGYVVLSKMEPTTKTEATK
jgi:hypothetical protein